MAENIVVKMYVLNPKAQPLNELYGEMDPVTRDWTGSTYTTCSLPDYIYIYVSSLFIFLQLCLLYFIFFYLQYVFTNF